MTSSWGVKSKLSTPVIEQIKLHIVASPIQLPFSLSDTVSVVHMLLYYRYIGRDNRITTWLCDRNQRNYSIFKMQFQLRIGHVDIGIMFLCFRNSEWCLYNTQSKSDVWPTQSQGHCKLIGWYWKIKRRQLRTLTCPFHMKCSVEIWNTALT